MAAAAPAPKTKIFVGHLPDGCRSEDLQALFEKHGAVKECDVINKYGFVHMGTAEEAAAAIKALNNFEFMGSHLSVEQAKSKLHPEPGASGRAMGNVGRRGSGMSPRNGFGPMRGGVNGSFAGTYTNGYRRFDTAPYPDYSYGDRSYGFARDHLRPYPTPYERRPLELPPMRKDYSRPLAPPPVPRDLYAPRPLAAPLGPHRTDLYERQPLTERPDYLYSRRSPPQSSLPMSSFWYDDSFGERDSRTTSFAARRTPYY